MLNEFLKEAVAIIVGKPSENIVEFLNRDKYTNEFIIAKKLDNTINQTRNILYKLSDQGVVSSMRKKDKKKGWYTYFWKIEVLKTLEFLKEYLGKRSEQTKHQIDSREVKRFYICERCNIEMNEENALLNDFTCNECGNVMSLKDNTKVLKELKRNFEKQAKELELVEEEIGKEKEKLDKRKEKELKKEQKEKEKKREEKKKARQKEKEKLNAKSKAKPSKKKTLKKQTKKVEKAKPSKKKIKKAPPKKSVKKTAKKRK